MGEGLKTHAETLLDIGVSPVEVTLMGGWMMDGVDIVNERWRAAQPEKAAVARAANLERRHLWIDYVAGVNAPSQDATSGEALPPELSPQG